MNQNLAKRCFLGISFLVTMLMPVSGPASETSDKWATVMSGKTNILAELMQSADLIIIGKLRDIKEVPKNQSDYIYTTVTTLEIERIVGTVWNSEELGYYVDKEADKRMINVLQKVRHADRYDGYGFPDDGEGYAFFDFGGRYLCWLRLVPLVPLSESQKKALGLTSSILYEVIRGKNGLVLLSNPKELQSYEYMKKRWAPKGVEPYLKAEFERNFGTSDVKKIEEATSFFAQLMVGNAGSSQELQRLAQTNEPIYSLTAAQLLRLQNTLRRFIYVEQAEKQGPVSPTNKPAQ